VDVNRTLVARAIVGDEGAISGLLAAVWPDAYRIAWSVLRDGPAAEDAAQEACARVWRSIGGLRDAGRFKVWFCRIVVNESRRLQGRAKHGEAAADVAPNDRPLFDERVAVRLAIDALDPRLRSIVVFRYYFGLRSREIARVLGVSPVTIRWRLMLAHRRLACALADDSHANPQRDERYGDESIAAS